jgi:hypothetical protein
LDFKGHNRASPPVEVSVYVADHQLLVSPHSVPAGLATLNVTNQSGSSADVKVGVFPTNPDGVPPAYWPPTLAKTGLITAGGTAQITVDLRHAHRLYVFWNGRTIGGLATTARQAGNSALLQP